MAETTKTYVPKSSAREVTFRNGNSILKLSFHVETFRAFLDQHKNERGWINLGVSKRKQPSDKGDTHCLWLDTWQPQQRATMEPGALSRAVEKEIEATEPKQEQLPDVPF